MRAAVARDKFYSQRVTRGVAGRLRGRAGQLARERKPFTFRKPDSADDAVCHAAPCKRKEAFISPVETLARMVGGGALWLNPFVDSRALACASSHGARRSTRGLDVAAKCSQGEIHEHGGAGNCHGAPCAAIAETCQRAFVAALAQKLPDPRSAQKGWAGGGCSGVALMGGGASKPDQGAGDFRRDWATEQTAEAGPTVGWSDNEPEGTRAKMKEETAGWAKTAAPVVSAGINATYAPKFVVPSKIVGIPKSIPMDFMKANTSLLDSATSNTTDALVQTLVGTQPLFGPRPQRLVLDVDSGAQAAAPEAVAAADPSLERIAGNETVNATDNVTNATDNATSSDASSLRPAYDAWYRSGWMTTSPEVMVKLVMRPLKLPDEPDPSPVDVMRIGVFSRLLLEDLAPKLFDLTMTGVSYDVDVWTGGATIVLSGFGAMLPGLGEKIISALDAFGKNSGTVTTLEQKRFTRITQKLTDDLQTFSNMPVSHALQDLQLLLTKGPHAAHEKLLALEEVTVENAKKSVNELLCSRPMVLTASVIGNIGEAEAQSMTSAFTKQLKEACMDSAAENSTYSVGEVEHITPVVQVAQPVEVRAPNPRKGDPNDAIVFSLISNVSTVERRVKLALLGQILDPLAFNELRSQRQLGYVVQAGMSQFSNVLAINCLVQSTSLGADQLEAAIEYVLTKLMIERLHTLTAKDFLGYKDSLRQMLVQPPASIGEEMEFFWASIVKGGLCFDLRDQMLRYLDGPDVTIEALLDEWTELATPKKGLRRKVVVKYFAAGVPDVPSQ
ncbi:unnamed protein product, partial [Prorocentrum cordatum]